MWVGYTLKKWDVWDFCLLPKCILMVIHVKGALWVTPFWFSALHTTPTYRCKPVVILLARCIKSYNIQFSVNAFFCISAGDINHREGHHPVYRGWVSWEIVIHLCTVQCVLSPEPDAFCSERHPHERPCTSWREPAEWAGRVSIWRTALVCNQQLGHQWL